MGRTARRPKSNYISRARNYARQGYRVASAVYSGYNQYVGNSVGSRVGAKQTVAPPTTNQTNVRTTYKKKKTSRKWAKRRVKKYKRFRHMQFKALGVSHQVYRWSERGTAGVNAQAMNVLCLRGCNGTDEKEFHLKALSDNMTTSTSTSEEQFRGMNYLTQSVMDWQVRNSSSETAIIDMYHFVCKRDLCKADATSTLNTNNDIKNMLIKVGELNNPSYTDTTGSTTAADVQDIGLTPFQCPDFCQYFTIVKKEHMQLNQNQIATGQIKSMKKLYYNTDLVENLVARKGQTMGIVFVFRSTYDGDTGVDDYPEINVDFSAQWTYALKKNIRNLDTIYMDPSV